MVVSIEFMAVVIGAVALIVFEAKRHSSGRFAAMRKQTKRNVRISIEKALWLVCLANVTYHKEGFNPSLY